MTKQASSFISPGDSAKGQDSNGTHLPRKAPYNNRCWRNGVWFALQTCLFSSPGFLHYCAQPIKSYFTGRCHPLSYACRCSQLSVPLQNQNVNVFHDRSILDYPFNFSITGTAHQKMIQCVKKSLFLPILWILQHNIQETDKCAKEWNSEEERTHTTATKEWWLA